MIDYPKNHQLIVTQLIDGKFITVDDVDLYEIIKEKLSFYKSFFDESFGLELIFNFDYVYLESPNTDENTSRDISVFFSILCFELDKNDKNFIDELNFSDFYIEDFQDYIDNSTWKDVIQDNAQLRNLKSLLKKMVNKNIARKEPNGKYSFTKAYKLFIEFAAELASRENKTNEKSS